VVRLPATITDPIDLEIRPPQASAGNDPARVGELASEGLGVVWRWNAPDVPGVYRVERGGTTLFAVPIHFSDEESQLEPLPADVLLNRLAVGRAVHFRALAGGGDSRDVIWTWLLTACVVCLLSEISALWLFRS
jgi:hypothetical protein